MDLATEIAHRLARLNIPRDRVRKLIAQMIGEEGIDPEKLFLDTRPFPPGTKTVPLNNLPLSDPQKEEIRQTLLSGRRFKIKWGNARPVEVTLQ